ncbi:MAG: hypothetical protein GY947_16240 [Rhodobacteraceae bacterium]|nr:hypothetical protein [Paracoccaceae bacterium]
MSNGHTSNLMVVIVAATVFAVTGSITHAQEAEIQTIYATKKGACGKDVEKQVEISEGRIVGPGFDCALSAGRPAGTGLVAYEATCTVDGKKMSEGIALDLSNYRDHFELSLPGREDWLALYPCTPVPGLT